MMDLNFFFLFWFSLVVALVLMFLLTKFSAPHLAKLLKEIQLYGKAKRSYDLQTKGQPLPEPIKFLVNGLQIPKRQVTNLLRFEVK